VRRGRQPGSIRKASGSQTREKKGRPSSRSAFASATTKAKTPKNTRGEGGRVGFGLRQRTCVASACAPLEPRDLHRLRLGGRGAHRPDGYCPSSAGLSEGLVPTDFKARGAYATSRPSCSTARRGGSSRLGRWAGRGAGTVLHGVCISTPGSRAVLLHRALRASGIRSESRPRRRNLVYGRRGQGSLDRQPFRISMPLAAGHEKVSFQILGLPSSARVSGTMQPSY